MHVFGLLRNAVNDGSLSSFLSKLFSPFARLVAYLSNQHSDETVYGSQAGADSVRNLGMHSLAKRDVEKGSAEFIVFACLIPVLVILSGIFAGLTLGYMSLDETQLNVLSVSGTPYVFLPRLFVTLDVSSTNILHEPLKRVFTSLLFTSDARSLLTANNASTPIRLNRFARMDTYFSSRSSSQI